jgi:hypothetical protein
MLGPDVVDPVPQITGKIIGCDQKAFSVTQGQRVELVKQDGATTTSRLTKPDGSVIIVSSSFVLEVTATDASGNTGTFTCSPQF